MAVARYLVDTSAYSRLTEPQVARRLIRVIEAGLVATCSTVDLELLYATRSPTDYRRLARQLSRFERLDTEQPDLTRALETQGELARRSRTRSVGVADLVIAAVAQRHRVTLLHYDSDFETVAAVTGQAVEWVVPRGSAS